MAFDLSAMRAMVRFLIRDPSSRAISDNDLRDLYIVPAYDDWWARFERRPARALGGVIVFPANAPYLDLIVGGAIGVGINPATRIEGVELITGSAQIKRMEWNRLRQLQETEGATGTPAAWAGLYTSASLTAEFFLALYPTPTAATNLQCYGSGVPSEDFGSVSGGGDTVATDPLAARWIARFAAYKAALALNLTSERIEAILMGLPQWAKAEIKIDSLHHGRQLPEEIQKLYRPEDVVA